MRILGLDTSGDTCSVGIMDDDRIIAELSVTDRNTHSVNLMPLVDRVLRENDLSICDIDAFAVNVGPGSFTGIRIGVCTVMGMAMNRHTPCIGVNTLESLAYNAQGFTGTICPMIDARRQESYWSLFGSDGRDVERISDDGAEKVVDILTRLPEGTICFVGDGALKNRAMIEEALGERAVFLPESAMIPCAASTLKAAKAMAEKGGMQPAYELAPYYLRPSQAEQMKAGTEG